MTEKNFLDYKIPILIKEGKTKQVASAIAYSMWKQEQKHTMQQAGGFNIYDQTISPQQDFSVQNQDYLRNAFTPAQEVPQTLGNQNVPEPNWYDQNKTYFELNQPSSPQYDSQVYKQGEVQGATPKQAKNQNYNTQIFNPFGGVSLEQSLFGLGQGIGEKDPFKTAVNAGLSGLKLARIGLSGYSTGKEDRRVKDEFFRNINMDNRTVTTIQQGGEIKQADVLTGKYIVDQKQGNVELEANEHVKDNTTGNIQKVVGDSHIDGGVTTTLEDSKILSDYTKIGAKNAKELKNRYQISLKSSDTFAKAMDKVNKKIGVEKATEELAETIKKIGKNESVKSKPTQKLNEEYLTKEIEEYQTKLDELSGAQNTVFEDLFDRQEAIPKKGNPGDILDKNGKVVQTRNEDVSQQGSEYTMDDFLNSNPSQTTNIAPQMPIDKILYNVRTDGVREGNLQPGYYTRVDYKNGKKDYLNADGHRDLKKMNNYRLYMEGLQNKPISTQVVAGLQEGGQIFELASKHGISPERANQLIYMQMGGEMEQQSSQEEQIMQMIVQMLQQGATPEQVLEQLIAQGIPQEVATQFIQMASQNEMPQEQQMEVAQEGKNFLQNSTLLDEFSNQPSVLERLPYTPRETNPNEIWRGENYSNVWKPLVEKSMSNPEQAKKIDDWLMANKGTFSPNVQKQLENKTGAGRYATIQKLATDEKPGLFHNAVLQAIQETAPVKPVGDIYQPKDQENVKVNTEEETKLVYPNLPVDYILPPSAMQPIAKPYVPFGRAEAVKQTVEPYLAEQERQRQTDVARIEQSGMSPQQQEAVLAQGLASSQIASNDAISKVENFNAQNQAQTDQFNIGQTTKEALLNAQFNMDYQNKAMKTLANQESAMRRYYNTLNDQNRQNFMDVRDLNTLNAAYDKFKTDGSNIIFEKNNNTTQYNQDPEFLAWWDKATPQQRDAFRKQEIERTQKKLSTLT